MTDSAPLSAADLIPITVLTGFLGSGKTTLLNALLKHPEMGETAVLINEFGEIGLDHLLVEAVDDDVILLNSGCLCCTVRSDLLTALRDLYFKRVRGLVPEFTRLIIETTGLADPAPILHTLITDPLLSVRYRLDGIVATIDAVNASSQFDSQPESVKQAAVADRLVLTKLDLCDQATRDSLFARLRQINPAAPMIYASHGQVAPSALLNAGLFSADGKHPDVARWLRDEAYHGQNEHAHDHHGHGHGHVHHEHEHHEHEHHHDLNRHDDRICAYSLTYESPIEWESFVSAMEMLIAHRGADLLRMKGLLNLTDEERPVVVHGVQHVFHPPAGLPQWPDGDHRSKLVFITRDIPRPLIEQLFNEVLGQSCQ
jgi:G3E family GTPase